MPGSGLPASKVVSPSNQDLEHPNRATQGLSPDNTARSTEPGESFGADLSEDTIAGTYSVRRSVPYQESSSQRATVDASSVREVKAPPMLSMMESYGHASEAPSEFRWWHGVILALIILLFVGGVGIGGWFWWSHRKSPAQAAAEAPTTTQGSFSEEPSASPTLKSLKASNTSTSPSADEALRSLLDRRTKEQPSDSSRLTAAYADAEKKYPNDYRFSYERAKLSIVGVATHHEAFGALAVAAEKAIDNGKAQEMLDSLMADKESDFYKLSRGHREWQILQEALRNRDKAQLQALRH